MNANLRIGIQGGEGSFNYQALVELGMRRQGVQDYEPVFLFTTEAVLSALQAGKVDRGQFALYNSTCGPVEETMEAIGMGRFTFEVLDSYSIPIAHALICKKGVELAQIRTILTHPKVLEQCEGNLRKHYDWIEQKRGEGDMIDPARAAQALRDDELPDDHATLSCSALSDVFGLKILATDLQDSSDNATTFLYITQGNRDVTKG